MCADMFQYWSLENLKIFFEKGKPFNLRAPLSRSKMAIMVYELWKHTIARGTDACLILYNYHVAHNVFLSLKNLTRDILLSPHAEGVLDFLVILAVGNFGLMPFAQIVDCMMQCRLPIIIEWIIQHVEYGRFQQLELIRIFFKSEHPVGAFHHQRFALISLLTDETILGIGSPHPMCQCPEMFLKCGKLDLLLQIGSTDNDVLQFFSDYCSQVILTLKHVGLTHDIRGIIVSMVMP